jgi:outer membrane immunogenic protein
VLGLTCMDTDYIPSTGPDPELNGCGFVGGALAGFNYQISDFVLGVEGDYMWGGNTSENVLDAVNYSVDGLATLRGRFGWLHADTLFYATAGIGWLNGTMDALVGPMSIPASDSATHTGFVIGGGIEHAFTPNFHGRLEYLYGSFGKENYDLSVSTCGATTCIVDLDFKHLHTIRASLTWNFGSLFW